MFIFEPPCAEGFFFVIKSLARANGGVIDNQVELEVVTTQIYKELFTSEGMSNMQGV